MENVKIGVITIGQSPRSDAIEDIKSVLKDNQDIIEKGALDDFSLEYVVKNLGPSKDETILVSRMRDGSQVILSEEKIIPLIQKSIYSLENECNIIVLMCTGRFPKMDYKKTIVVYPQKVVHNIAEALIEDTILGIIVPDESQIPQIKRYWSDKGISTCIEAVSPYLELENLEKVCEKFKNSSCEFILLDCMGYSKKIADIVKRITRKKVILSRSVAFSTVSEIV